VGHDIGLMVAYAYRGAVPAETEQLVAEGRDFCGRRRWGKRFTKQSTIWHLRFNGSTRRRSSQGRERIYCEHLWKRTSSRQDAAIPEADRVAYAAAYGVLDACAPRGADFVRFQPAGADFEALSRTKLTMPVLAMGGEKATADA